MAGQPYVIRLVSGLCAPKNPVPGLGVAGPVVAAGAEFTGFAVGEEVSTGPSAMTSSWASPATRRWPGCGAR